ncbi:hypothetical protein IMCC1989_2119 [gamma proteobacterium IMCC1989]|nr:hypothetical protein IMCC1989_2119 [gamma proteobacterium IMCC1989]
MNRQKKIKQKLKKKAKAANLKANPKKASTYVSKADREKQHQNTTTMTNHPETDQT